MLAEFMGCRFPGQGYNASRGDLGLDLQGARAIDERRRSIPTCSGFGKTRPPHGLVGPQGVVLVRWHVLSNLSLLAAVRPRGRHPLVGGNRDNLDGEPAF